MFSMDLKHVTAAMLAAAPIFSMADGVNNSNPFNQPDIKPKGIVVAGSEYVPDSGDNGKPTIRITVGAPRGGKGGSDLTIVLPIDRTIYASSPFLTWETGTATKQPVKLTFTSSNSGSDIAEIRFAPPASTGPHQIDLREFPALRPGEEYEWSMTLCMNSRCLASSEHTARAAFHYAK